MTDTTKLWLDRHDPAHVQREPLDKLRAERDALQRLLRDASRFVPVHTRAGQHLLKRILDVIGRQTKETE